MAILPAPYCFTNQLPASGSPETLLINVESMIDPVDIHNNWADLPPKIHFTHFFPAKDTNAPSILAVGPNRTFKSDH